jgi:hypothetical protein
MVPGVGIEPTLLSEGDFESGCVYQFHHPGLGNLSKRELWHSSAMSTMKYPTIEDAIGSTPLVALQRIGKADERWRAAMWSWASWRATTRRGR